MSAISLTDAGVSPTDSSGPMVLRPGEALGATWLVSELMEPLVTDAQTGGRYDLVRCTAAPDGGPPPHRHGREDEIFYIVDGTFSFVFDDTILTASAGSAVFLPRGITHTYNNVTDEPGTLLVLAAPSGFAKFVEAGGFPCIDKSQPRPIGPETFEKLGMACDQFGIALLPTWKANRAAAPRRTPRDLWVLGQHVRILLTSADTNGSFSVVEVTSNPGEFVPPHLHKEQDEMFYVLEGMYEFDLPEGTVTAPAGTLVRVPKGVMHGFRNAGTERAKLVNYHTPGGFERFFEEAGTECTDITAGPPKTAPDMERLVRLFEAHGMELPAPPAEGDVIAD